MFDKIKKLFTEKEVTVDEKNDTQILIDAQIKAKKEKERAIRAKKKAEKLAAEQKLAAESQKAATEKDKATLAGEPYITVVKVNVDATNPGNGSFELDWNDIFVAHLIKAGYHGATDTDIVDNWFKETCRNVVLETYEQEQADPDKRRSNRKDLGGGRTEVS